MLGLETAYSRTTSSSELVGNEDNESLLARLFAVLEVEGCCSSFRRATVNEIMPGTGPSSCMAFLRVSMAEGLALPNKDIPLMLTN